jgi:hypothetical protein
VLVIGFHDAIGRLSLRRGPLLSSNPRRTTSSSWKCPP